MHGPVNDAAGGSRTTTSGVVLALALALALALVVMGTCVNSTHRFNFSPEY